VEDRNELWAIFFNFEINSPVKNDGKLRSGDWKSKKRRSGRRPKRMIQVMDVMAKST
jgi:hypothetical protein